MGIARRVYKILTGIMMIIAGVLLLSFPDYGYMIVILILDMTLLLYGLRLLVYYLTLARFMVGGIMTLYKSIIVIDFGLFVFNMQDVPQHLAMIYLAGIMAFSGLLEVLKSLDAKRLEAGSWKYQMFYGGTKIIIAVTSLFFLDSVTLMTYIYCAGLFHSAVSSIVTAFRKTAIVYIS